MANPPQEQPPPFSLCQGGLFYRIERRLGLVREPPPDHALRMWAGVVITFLPLVVLAAIQGVLVGNQVALPLLLDLTVYARFAFAIPLLVGAERNIDSRLADAVRQLRRVELVGTEVRPDLEAGIRRLEHARDSVLPEAIILAGAFVLGWINNHAILGLPVSSWRALTPGILSSTTLAGHWLDLVSLPLFNFLAFRWLWRIALWSLFLWRVSRIELNLIPTHPDGSAGLGFLGGVHAVFGSFLVPVAASVAARGVQWVQYSGGSVDFFRNAAVAFAVIGLAVALGPLLVFTPRLIRAKRQGLLDYGGFADEYTRGFQRKWLGSGRDREESPLGSGDIQSLADLGNSYAVVRSMRVVVPSTRHAVTLVLAAALPMVPFLAFIVPLKQILKVLMQLVMR
jgi:hypothetical protein